MNIHQKSLFTPLVEAVDFARQKKGLTNVHIVIPFVRNVHELQQLKRELAVYKLVRKASLGIWLEMAVPENIINIEDIPQVRNPIKRLFPTLDNGLDGTFFSRRGENCKIFAG